MLYVPRKILLRKDSPSVFNQNLNASETLYEGTPEQRSPTFLAPGTSFVEGNFSKDGGWEGMVQAVMWVMESLACLLTCLPAAYLLLCGLVPNRLVPRVADLCSRRTELVGWIRVCKEKENLSNWLTWNFQGCQGRQEAGEPGQSWCGSSKIRRQSAGRIPSSLGKARAAQEAQW